MPADCFRGMPRGIPFVAQALHRRAFSNVTVTYRFLLENVVLVTISKHNIASSEIKPKQDRSIRGHRKTAAATAPAGEIVMKFTAKLINIAAAALAGSLLFAGLNSAHAANNLVARVSISEQKMEVLVDGRPTFEWKVSTAGKGYVTPTGAWKPTRMHAMWYSRKYDNAPMPHSIFFTGGYAVHATNAIKKLGQPASHGCIRLHPDNAADLYRLVETFGPSNTQIVIVQ
jgi:lipoprotein-anchoring transpeptidase ErfK/SrfK